ncbi:hypothetical protein PROFUN_08177 [Planoprotostelium fungivorum]|uniref:PIPK domain-containing protein n=1 Tax=Planoprotostelium fungivorum TaxID=1890364 RepID=A0A2P6N637_9EUKA|nr:hypothetical protein PROFUN_08177 [Planoprotostelium fungivorum]
MSFRSQEIEDMTSPRQPVTVELAPTREMILCCDTSLDDARMTSVECLLREEETETWRLGSHYQMERMSSASALRNSRADGGNDADDIVNRDWMLNPEGIRFRKELFAHNKKPETPGRPAMEKSITKREPWMGLTALLGILDEPSIPPSIVAEVREYKIVVYGKTGAGKTSTVMNLCGADIPSTHVETSGIQVVSSFWPIQRKSNNRVVVLKYKLWDCGFAHYRKFNYLAEAMNTNTPKAFLFVFSITDKESLSEVEKQITQLNSDPQLKSVIKMVIATKNDYFFRAEVTKQELVDFSAKFHVPIYFIKNLPDASPSDKAQTEKDMMRIKNDLAEFILTEKDYSQKVQLFKNESRFTVRDRKSEAATRAFSRSQALNTPNSNTSFPDLTIVRDNMQLSYSDDESFGIPATPGFPSPPLLKSGTVASQHPTKVSESSHPSYQLVFDMLTGITTSIVESSAYRAKREEQMKLDYTVQQIVLLPKDFATMHRFNSKEKNHDEEIININMDHHKDFTFRFTDYAPFVFENMRRNFGYDTGDYLKSLGEEIALYELSSPGKSGSFFYFSLDYNFIIKTIVEAEVELFFENFLRSYYQYMLQNPNTLIVRFFGLHMVQPRGYNKELYFTIMDNTLQSEFGMVEKYDLKGSTVGRYASEKEKEHDNVIFKDLDIVMKRKIRLGPINKKKLMDQLEKDTRLLADNNVMDYSFLVGITIPDPTKMKRPLIDDTGKSPPRTRHTSPSIFKADYGGIYSKDRDEIYFFSIIDVFQAWNVRKKVENSLKSLIHESHGISAVRPDVYRERFLKFLNEIIE